MNIIDLNEFNERQEDLLTQFGVNVLGKDKKISYDEACKFFHNYLSDAKSNILNLNSVDLGFENGANMLFLKNLQMMLFAFKYGMYFSENQDNISIYNADDSNYFDMMMFLKDKNQELELFRLSLNELDNNAKVNLTFYDDIITFDYFDHRVNSDKLYKTMQENKRFNKLGSEADSYLKYDKINGIQADSAWVRKGYIIKHKEIENRLLDEIYSNYSNCDIPELYSKRKRILRDSLLEVGGYNQYFDQYNACRTSDKDNNCKKLVKSFPYIDVHCEFKR